MGFFSGFMHLLLGIRFILSTRRVRACVAVAPALSAVALALLGWAATTRLAGISSLSTGLERWTSLASSWWLRELTHASLTPALLAMLIVASLIQPFSAGALDIVACEQAWRISRRAWAEGDAMSAPLRCLESTICGLAFSLVPLILLSFIASRYAHLRYVVDAVSFAVAGANLAWNFLEYPLSQRDMRVGERLRWIRRHRFVVLGFGITSAALLVVPIAGLVVVPAGVAGATRMMLECDRRDGVQRRRRRVVSPLTSASAAGDARDAG